MAVAVVASVSRWIRLATICMVSLGACLLTRSAHAQPEPQLRWQAPPECPSRDAVLGALRARSSGAIDLAEVAVVAEVRRENTGFRLHLIISAASGRIEQSVFAQLCATFSELIALEAELAAAPLSLVQKTAHTPVPNQPSPAESKTVQTSVRAAAELWVGLWPRVAPGAELALGIVRHRLRVEFGFHQLLPQELRYAELPDVGGRVRLGTGQVKLCGLTRLGPVQLANCGALEAGAMHAVGRGVEAPRASVQGMLALGASLGLRYPSESRLGAWVNLEALLQLRQVHFHVRGEPELFRNDRAQFRAGAGIDVGLW